jgi:hypothetical protein
MSSRADPETLKLLSRLDLLLTVLLAEW